jgi:hypothetical protein
VIDPYPSEIAMRAANPWICVHLVTIAQFIDGQYVARICNQIYVWNA